MNDIKMNTAGLDVKQNAGSSAAHSASGSGAKVAEDSGQARQKAEGTTQAQDQQKVKEAVTRLNDYVQTVQRNLQFNLDEGSGKTIITVVDKNTAEVVRQIPDDVALKLAQDLQQEEPLSLFNAKV